LGLYACEAPTKLYEEQSQRHAIPVNYKSICSSDSGHSKVALLVGYRFYTEQYSIGSTLSVRLTTIN